MHSELPQYGFSSHKGYSTPEPLESLDRYGPCRHHRMDFAPCAAAALARRELA
jgi:ribonuclease HII